MEKNIMKRFVLYVSLVVIGSLQGMSRDQKEGGPSKRGESEEVRELKRKIPGTNRYLNLNDIDPITHESYEEMLKDKEFFPAGIDIIETLSIDPTGTPYHHYLHAKGLRDYIYAGGREHPITRLPMERRFLYPLYIKDIDSQLVRIPLDEVIPNGGYNEVLRRADEAQVAKDYEKLRRYLEIIAHQKVDPSIRVEAQYVLGEMYSKGLLGNKTAESYETARQYLMAAVNQEVDPSVRAEAQYVLGKMYAEGLLGNKTAEDYETARQYLIAVVNQEVDPSVRAIAQYGLGAMYGEDLLGNKTAEGYEMARQYLMAAVNQEVNQFARVAAQYVLGAMYAEGQLGNKRPEDYEMARQYLQKVIQGQFSNIKEIMIRERALKVLQQMESI